MRRLAVALAWYALIPPLSGNVIEAGAPLARWEQLRAFDSAETCEQVVVAYTKQMIEQTDNAARIRSRQVQYVRCISASDPRLREVLR